MKSWLKRCGANVPKLTLTQSMIGMFEKCGMQFYFRYIEGIKIPPAAALSVGHSVDTGITTNLSQKIQTQVDLPEGDVLDATSTAFEKVRAETDWQDLNPDSQKDVAIGCVKAHHKEIAPKIEPIATQITMKHELPELVLEGTADIIEKDGTIADSKTAKSAYDEDAVHTSLQAAVYSYLYAQTTRQLPKGFRFDVMVKPTVRLPARTMQVTGQVTQGQVNNAIERAKIVERAVKAGIFPYASEQGYWCSKKMCGFWNMCPRGGKK